MLCGWPRYWSRRFRRHTHSRRARFTLNHVVIRHVPYSDSRCISGFFFPFAITSPPSSARKNIERVIAFVAVIFVTSPTGGINFIIRLYSVFGRKTLFVTRLPGNQEFSGETRRPLSLLSIHLSLPPPRSLCLCPFRFLPTSFLRLSVSLSLSLLLQLLSSSSAKFYIHASSSRGSGENISRGRSSVKGERLN